MNKTVADVVAFLVKLAPYVAELYEMSKTDEAAAIQKIDARVAKERKARDKRLGK